MKTAFQKIKSIYYFTMKKGNFGFCPICETKTFFIRANPWLRDYYQCINCRSIPRHRALINALNVFYPEWRISSIHESSPGGVSSDYISKTCDNYSYSHFFPETTPGSLKNGIRCENLERMTFNGDSFDVFITQDVFEHINHPQFAFQEIARVLKPGGVHIFSVPLYRELNKTRPRIFESSGSIQYLQEPIFHGNPIDKKGSLVTYDYGLDLPELIFASSKMMTTMYLQRDPFYGLDGEFLEIFISRKPG